MLKIGNLLSFSNVSEDVKLYCSLHWTCSRSNNWITIVSSFLIQSSTIKESLIAIVLDFAFFNWSFSWLRQRIFNWWRKMSFPVSFTFCSVKWCTRKLYDFQFWFEIVERSFNIFIPRTYICDPNYIQCSKTEVATSASTSNENLALRQLPFDVLYRRHYIHLLSFQRRWIFQYLWR